MYEGKPLVLVVGSTDTGRTPIAGALLRRVLGAQAFVRTAGVLSHAGEGATPEAQMAVEQIGLDLSRHVAQPLHQQEHGQAELLLALDRGTELVLFTQFPNDPRVACLSGLAELPDVLDPHRMPLGVWVAAMRQLDEQVCAALPAIRQRLGLPAEPAVEPAHTSEPPAPLAIGVSQRADWSNDEQMQRLLGLINSAAAPHIDAVESYNGAESNGSVPEHEPLAAATTVADEPTAPPDAASDPPVEASDRAGQVVRMRRMLDVAAELPEIIDWQKLRQALVVRLRAIAQQPAGRLDFAPAAVLMIEGKLAQQTSLPDADALTLLHRSIGRLDEALPTDGLTAIGSELAQW